MSRSLWKFTESLSVSIAILSAMGVVIGLFNGWSGYEIASIGIASGAFWGLAAIAYRKSERGYWK